MMEDTKTIFVAFYLLLLGVLGYSLSSFRQSIVLDCHLFSFFWRQLIFPFVAKSSWYYVIPLSLSLPLFSDTDLHSHLGFEVFGI